MSENTINDALIQRIETLLAYAKEGNESEVNQLIDELSIKRETSLYQQLGKLTRDLHETIANFSQACPVEDFANVEMQDARERLHFVISKTQQAADLTMTQIESSIPICNEIVTVTDDLAQSWNKLCKKEMKADEFRKLSKSIKVFLATANKDGETLKNNLNEVLLAQDFQDITGQVIYKVIKLIEDVEAGLVNLIKLASEHLSVARCSNETEQKALDQSKDKAGLDGPIVPGVNNMNESVSGQDEVDDLLSSLGF